MKSSIKLFLCVVAASVWASACAATSPSHELVVARRAYAEATTPGTPVASAPLLEAQRDLNAAERAHVYSPQSTDERHLAYLATREAQIAMARGSAQAARIKVDQASDEYNAMLECRVKQQQAALNEAHKDNPVCAQRSE
jgi:hypothetical protein